METEVNNYPETAIIIVQAASRNEKGAILCYPSAEEAKRFADAWIRSLANGPDLGPDSTVVAVEPKQIALSTVEIAFVPRASRFGRQTFVCELRAQERIAFGERFRPTIVDA